MNKHVVRLVKAAISFAFFFALALWIRKRDFTAPLHALDGFYLALSILIVPALFGASVAKWRLLLRMQGHRLPFLSLVRIYLIGSFFSNLLPSNVGGDVVRLFYAGRRIGSHGHAASSVFFERVTGILLLLVMVVFSPLLKPGLMRLPQFWIPALGAAGLLVVFGLLFRMRNPFAWVFGVFLRIAGALPLGRLGSKAEKFGRRGIDKAGLFQDKLRVGLDSLKASPAAVAALTAWTLGFYLLAGVNVWLAFKTFGQTPVLLDIIAILPTAMMVGMIPVTIGNWGIAETSYVLYFSLAGMPAEATLWMALLLRAKTLMVGLTGWLSYTTYPGERFTRKQGAAMENAREPPPAP